VGEKERSAWRIFKNEGEQSRTMTAYGFKEEGGEHAISFKLIDCGARSKRKNDI